MVRREEEGQLVPRPVPSPHSPRRKKKAICAVAASMLTALYHMLKNRIEHEDLGSDHFDRRSADFKAKRLFAHLNKLGFEVALQPLEKAA
jgi:hypothetical protein